MKWLAVAAMWLAVAAATVGCAIVLGTPARVSVVWVALVGFACAMGATWWIADA